MRMNGINALVAARLVLPAPVFSRVMAEALRLYHVAPDNFP